MGRIDAMRLRQDGNHPTELIPKPELGEEGSWPSLGGLTSNQRCLMEQCLLQADPSRGAMGLAGIVVLRIFLAVLGDFPLRGQTVRL